MIGLPDPDQLGLPDPGRGARRMSFWCCLLEGEHNGLLLGLALATALLWAIGRHPKDAAFAAKFGGRILELCWLFLPLVPLLGFCLATDGAGSWRPEPPHKLESWVAYWWDLLLRRAQRSGPVLVKLGQWAATRPDLIPKEWCTELGRLHDTTEPHLLDFTHRVLADAFSHEWFKSLLIEPEPIGSGCIAQVYIGHLLGDAAGAAPPAPEKPGGPPAKPAAPAPGGCLSGLRLLLPSSGWPLRRGEQPAPQGPRPGRTLKVAVKVVHPQVRRAVDVDLRVLEYIAAFSVYLGLESLGVPLMLRQFAAFLEAQTDLRTEASNIRRLGQCFSARDGPVVVPEVYEGWVSRDAIVMSFEEGEPLNTLLEGPDGDPSGQLEQARMEAWKSMVDAFWAMVFNFRFVHGDLHPGNIVWRMRKGGRVQLAMLDCGLVIDLGGQAGEDLTRMVKAFLSRPAEEVAEMLIELSERVGGRPEDVWNPDGFVRGIAELIRRGLDTRFALSKLNAGALMGQSLILGRRHRVRFDARFVNLMVAMCVVQGVAMRLNADGDLLNRMRPYVFSAAVGNLVSGSLRSRAGGEGSRTVFRTGGGKAHG